MLAWMRKPYGASSPHENCRQLSNTEIGRNFVLEKNTWIIQYQTVTPRNLQTGSIIQAEQVVCSTKVCIHIKAMDLKEGKESHMGRFGGRRERGKMM